MNFSILDISFKWNSTKPYNICERNNKIYCLLWLVSLSIIWYHTWYTLWKKVKMKSFSHVWLFATLWTVTCQAPLSMGFSRQEYWSGLPFPSPEELPNPGIEPRSPTLQADALPSEPLGKPDTYGSMYRYFIPFHCQIIFYYMNIPYLVIHSLSDRLFSA